MSVQVIAQSFVQVTTVIFNNSFVFTAPQSGGLSPITAAGLYRVSLYLSVPSSATGQSVGLQAYTQDSSGGTTISTISTNFCAPGQSAYLVGLLYAEASNNLDFAVVVNGAETFVSTCNVSICVEKL